MRRILLVDDEENMLTVLEMLFRNSGYETVTARSGRDALDLFSGGDRVDVVVSDLKMPDMDGIELLKELQRRSFAVPFVLITAYGTVEKAVEAMKLGAVDVITKPFTKEIILEAVSRLCRIESLEDENQRLRASMGEETLVYRSEAMAKVAELLRKAGPAPTPVLITGESGTGKEIAARTLHRYYAGGDGEKKPYVSVNCPAVPESLLESELFGYRKGAFTGAARDRKGKVELASGGTLFFDEIGDLPPPIQPKLLRLLENKTYEPLGSSAVRRVDVRILCATNRDLRLMVREGRFREDLFYRINAITLVIPPLRDRVEDIPVLVEHFVDKYSRELGKSLEKPGNELIDLFVAYPWPGNVRELKNVIERAVVLCTGSSIGTQDLPAELRDPALSGDRGAASDDLLAASERRMLKEALEKTGGNVSEAARRLGITRNTMRYRMQKYGFAP